LCSFYILCDRRKKKKKIQQRERKREGASCNGEKEQEVHLWKSTHNDNLERRVFGVFFVIYLIYSTSLLEKIEKGNTDLPRMYMVSVYRIGYYPKREVQVKRAKRKYDNSSSSVLS